MMLVIIAENCCIEISQDHFPKHHYCPHVSHKTPLQSIFTFGLTSAFPSGIVARVAMDYPGGPDSSYWRQEARPAI
jgi:hypothetical protein